MSIDLSGFSAGWTFLGRAGLSTIGSAWSAVPPLPSGAVFAFVQGEAASVLQSFTTSAPGEHTIAFSVNSNWWPTGAQRLDVLIDGAVVYSTGAINSNAWARRTPPPWTPTAPGPHTIEFRSTNPDPNETAYIDSVTIADPSSVPIALANGNFDGYTVLAPGQLVYRPPAVATATFRATWAVTTCGKLLEFGLTRIDDGSTVTPGTINQAPTIFVNGVARGVVDFAGALTTSAHPTWLIPLPAGLVVAPGDVVTLSAPEGWAFGPAGYAEGMAGQPATNCVGRSFVRLADVPRTMWVGAAFAHHVTAEWHTGFYPRNQAKRCAYWVPSNVSEASGGKPLILGAASAVAPVVNVSAGSLLDSTGIPTPAGYWAVRWDDLDGHTTASLVNNGDGNTSATEVASLANPGAGGVGKVRVFDFEPTGPAVNLQVYLRLQSGNPDHSVNFDNLAILAPGDFTWAANTPTAIPMPAWSDVAGAVEAQMPPSLPFGPHRITPTGINLGESSACEREHAPEPDDFHWAQDVKDVRNVIYTQARPWTNAASPYIYDPLAGTDYPASLTAPITTAPPPGTVETITLAQVGDGLILTGLVLTIDSERFRVMNPPTGPPTALAVSVMRGVESTTPALHPISPPAVKAIAVSARRPMATLDSFGYQNQQITELVTQSPHRMKTGQILKMSDNGWPAFIYSDGRGFIGTWFAKYSMPVYVTGATTFVVVEPGGAVPGNPPTYPNTTLGSTYTLTPGDPATGADCYSQLYLPEYGGAPYELGATAPAKHPGVPAWVSFCMVSSDDMVDSIWRDRILPYLPADRDVWVEVGDEPWNSAGTPFFYWALMAAQLYGVYNAYYWYGVRVAHIRDRGKAIWAAAGRDPSHIKGSINVQDVNGTSVGGLLDWLASKSATPDGVAIAPYYNLYPDPAMWAAWAAWDTDELVDAWIWDYYRNTSPGDQGWSGASLHRVGDFKRGIDAWNDAQMPKGSTTLQVYEYGIDQPWPVYTANLGAAMDATTTTLTLPNANAYNPRSDAQDDCAKICPGTMLYVSPEWMKVVSRSGATCTVLRGQGGSPAVPHSPGEYFRGEWMEGTRDVTLHPNFRIAHRDVLERHQALGVALFIPSCECSEWIGGTAWADFHAAGQRPGMGDGSDGGPDNRLCEARRGRPNSKPATVNQDANTVSVRGQGMIDFLSGAAAVSPTPTPTPTPPTPTTAGRRWLESGAGRLLEGGGYRRLEGAKPVASGRLRPSYALSVVRAGPGG